MVAPFMTAGTATDVHPVQASGADLGVRLPIGERFDRCGDRASDGAYNPSPRR